ncbi:hypothetical protein KCP71_15040 [Salmonella enterica subsp. enterica]|nr:hypothetical protein KCP71_15040 [Salmonella enterica subsp. enterica]
MSTWIARTHGSAPDDPGNSASGGIIGGDCWSRVSPRWCRLTSKRVLALFHHEL